MKEISFVIPVFNNSNSLLILSEEINKLFGKYTLEIIFINDGSADDSLKVIKKISKDHNHVSFLSFSRNFGQVPAIVAGVRESKGKVTVVISADLQDPLDLVFDFYKLINNGSEVAIGYRIDREDNLISKITSKFFYSLMHLANSNIPKGGFDYFALGINAKQFFNKLDERNRFLQGDILFLGFTPVFLPYKRKKRVHGKSGWSFNKKLKYFIDGLLNTSYAPLRIMSLLGIIFSVTGALYSIIIVYQKIIENVPFKGWAPIMIIMLFTGGIIMVMLGIIGEYIWRIYDETRKRPYYLIEESTKNS